MPVVQKTQKLQHDEETQHFHIFKGSKLAIFAPIELSSYLLSDVNFVLNCYV